MADSRLTPGIIVLDKGLNLQAPKIAAPEGSVLDTLNYEQVDFQGQKRVDGYVRYDGQLGSYIDDYYILTAITGSVGEVYTDSDGSVVGVFVRADALAIIDYNKLPEGQWGKDVDTVDTHYTNVLAFNAVLRGLVGALPGPVAGLHWFNDRLYAIAPLTILTIAAASAPSVGTMVTAAGVTDPFPVIQVIDATTIVVGSIDLSPYVGAAITWAGGSGTISAVATTDTATFFEARTEIQSLAEDGTPANAGWKFIHQGWLVGFENGLSLYGSLPSLNQNLQGLGVQGPTPTTGNSGRPLLLNQGVAIAGEVAQVKGWKSSLSPTSYSLNPSDVWENDGVFTYADAYIQWDGDTGQVSAPGAYSGALVEYPATNTVEVDLT